MFETNIITITPVIPIRELCILPNSISHMDLTIKKSLDALEKAMATNQELVVVALKDSQIIKPKLEHLYEIGTVVRIKQVIKLKDQMVRVLVEATERARVLSFSDMQYYCGEVESVSLAEEESYKKLSASEIEAMRRELFAAWHRLQVTLHKEDKNIWSQFSSTEKLGIFMDQMIAQLSCNLHIKQKVLNEIDINSRFEVLSKIMLEECEISEVRNVISTKVKAKMEKNQREYVLREQMKVIRSELGEDDSESLEESYRKQVEELEASEEVKSRINKEISKLKRLSSNSSERYVEESYIETLLDMPWDRCSKDTKDIRRAEEILDEDHYGLSDVKERIVEYLAVRALSGKSANTILCLVGPPGTGKTSIAKSIARALNKEYARICLGGVSDEAQLRGHRKTYIGAMPGRIAVALKQVKVKNPVLLLDEIDKMGHDYKSDLASAMLEVLDSAQNDKFLDHYLEIPMDLSKAVFIATANDIEHIDKPLLDRMEVIELSGYTETEKFHIAKKYLLPKQIKENGLTKKQISVTDKALKEVIASYTKEAGVRQLERRIAKICRVSAKSILMKEDEKRKITQSNLEDILGPKKYKKDLIFSKNQIGLVRGLAWTSVGGVTLEIEVNTMPGKGEVKLTGSLGDVMKESALTAISYCRFMSEKNHIPTDYFEKHDIHIHVPQGAVPKDGPSAGVTMTTAIMSAVTNRYADRQVAMTGEVTLRGRVLEIGGLKEKLLAAKLAGVKKVFIPEGNLADLAKIDEEIKTGLNIIGVENVQEILSEVLI